MLMTLLAVLLVGGAQGDTALELMLQALGPEFSDFATAAATDLGPPVTTEQYTLFAPTNTAFEVTVATATFFSSIRHTCWTTLEHEVASAKLQTLVAESTQHCACSTG